MPLTSPPITFEPSPSARGPARRDLGIRGKMILIVGLPTLAIYVLVLGFALWHLSASSRRGVEQDMTERALRYAGGFDAAFEQAAAIARTTAALMEAAPDLTEAQIYAQLRANVLQNELVYGAAMAFEPGTFKKDDSLYCPYVHRQGGEVASLNITREVYDWYSDPRWQWWRLPKETNAAAWTDPYFDKGAGNVLMVTLSVPFRRDGRFRGVTTVDIQVSKIRQRLGTEILGDTEFVILTREGEFVYAPREADVMSGRTVFDILGTAGRPATAEAFRSALSGSVGVADLPAWRQPSTGWEQWADDSWLFYAPIKSAQWTFAAAVPSSLALAPARAQTAQLALALALTLVLIVACVCLMATLVSRPISRLADAVRRIARGDLDYRIDDAGHDEIGRLAHDVNSMAADLKQHIEEVAQARSNSREAIIFAMARLAESRDEDTGKHLERICRYTEVLAKELAGGDFSLTPEWVRTLVCTAALHDIGKIGIPDSILKKRGGLTEEERKQMQSHTTIGGDMLLDVRREYEGDDFLRIAAEIAFGHHEHWNGKGYPFGLSKENISLAARIVAVADVYDALTSRRVYKPPMPHEEAVAFIVKGSGAQFDPAVVAAFGKVVDKFREIAEGELASRPVAANPG